MELDLNRLYYLNADMIRFLLAENLALKMILHEKGILTPEEFKQKQEEAHKILDEKAKAQINQWQHGRQPQELVQKILQPTSAGSPTAVSPSSVISQVPPQ